MARQDVRLAWQNNISPNSFSCMFHISLDHRRFLWEIHKKVSPFIAHIHCCWSSCWHEIVAGLSTAPPFPGSSNFFVVHPTEVGWICLHINLVQTLGLHMYHKRSIRHIMRFFWIEQGRLSSRLENGLRESKEICLGFDGDKGWSWGDNSHTQARAYVVPTSHKCHLGSLICLPSCVAEGTGEGVGGGWKLSA